MVTGVEHPAPRANGTADRFRRVGGRAVLLAGGLAVRGPASRLTGSGVLRAGLLIIRSQTGAARRAAGVIHSHPVLSPSGSGFTPRNEISYRGVKPPRVSAGFGRSDLRCIPICRSSAGARRPGGRKGRGEVERPVAMGQDQADIQDQWIEGSPGKRRLTI